jgi:hypothetical protein
MTEEKPIKKGRSVALSGVIGFVLVALLVGMILGGAVSLFVVGPILYKSNDNQGNSGNQNTNYQNGNNNQGPITSSPNNNNQNGYNQGPTSSPNNNNQNGYNQGPTSSPNNNQNGNYTNDNSTQNNNGGQGMSNNNPPITNPTSQYSATGKQFSLNIPDQNGGQASGTISADVSCTVQQSGNNIQLDLTVTPKNIPQSLSQAVSSNSQVTFNFAGTTSGSQINAQASGNAGSDSSGPTFTLNLSGSIGSNTLTLTVTSPSNSQISISTTQPITLQSS